MTMTSKGIREYNGSKLFVYAPLSFLRMIVNSIVENVREDA